MHLLHAKAESSHAVDDFIRGRDPFEGRVAFVVRTMCARNAIARFTRRRLMSRISAARSLSVITTSARGRPSFAMPLLDHTWDHFS
jgi:hypothetical protein